MLILCAMHLQPTSPLLDHHRCRQNLLKLVRFIYTALCIRPSSIHITVMLKVAAHLGLGYLESVCSTGLEECLHICALTCLCCLILSTTQEVTSFLDVPCTCSQRARSWTTIAVAATCIRSTWSPTFAISSEYDRTDATLASCIDELSTQFTTCGALETASKSTCHCFSFMR